MINTPGALQNALGTFRNAIAYVTLRRAPRGGRPDLAGCLPRCVRTDGRVEVEVCAKLVPALAEPCTFVQWMLKEQRAAPTPDVRPVAPISIGWPSWPTTTDRARPCECHGTITHVTAAAVVGVCWHHPRPEHLRLALCHKWCRTCDSPAHYWDF